MYFRNEEKGAFDLDIFDKLWDTAFTLNIPMGSTEPSYPL